MRVLLTNDDGPPNDLASPYVKYLVEAIHKYTNWKLTICVPSSQKSWIGKAHFAGRDLTASYVYSKINEPEDNSCHGPFPYPNKKYSSDSSLQEWCLVDGTPASCTDIGIHHISPEPVDLVISGPNVGRNSSAIYITSSGTVGAAMEGALMNTKSIGLSYAYDKTSATDPKILKEASLISIKIIEKLYKTWSKEADLYTVNIPLLESLKLGETKIIMAPILENRWGTLFKSIKSPSSTPDGNTEVVSDIVDGAVSSGAKFKWSPDFAAVHKNIAQTTDITDGKVISLGHISITAMKAVFKQADELNSGEFVLDDNEDNTASLQNLSVNETNNNSIVLSYPETTYLYDPIKKAIDKFIPQSEYQLFQDLKSAPSNSKIFHYAEYEDLDHEKILSMGTGDIGNYMANSYTYRKGLIRKHYLAKTIEIHNAKNPKSILKKAVPETFELQLDYAEFLQDALDEYDLRCDLLENEDCGCEKTYILKPSMSDKGQGIRIFKTLDQLQAIFNSFEEDPTDDEEEEDDDETMVHRNDDDRNNNNGIMTSQLRHFIIQEYVDRPLLLEEYANRKFHIRTYVLCKGALEVYVYQRMLMLFSENEYINPADVWVYDEDAEEPDNYIFDMAGHLTNTCLQEDTDQEIVVEFDKSALKEAEKSKIHEQINSIVAELFSAALKVDRINFQPMKGAFEVFGLDFLVDSELNVHLLEVNSYPDFKQTGGDLKGLIYELFEGIVQTCVVPYFKDSDNNTPNKIENLEKVLDVSTNAW